MTGPEPCAELQRVIHTAVAITEGEVIPPEAILLEPRWKRSTPKHVSGTGDHPAPSSHSLPPLLLTLSSGLPSSRHIQRCSTPTTATSAGRPGPSAAFALHPLDPQLHGEPCRAWSPQSRPETTGPKLGPALVFRFGAIRSSNQKWGAQEACRPLREFRFSSCGTPSALKRAQGRSRRPDQLSRSNP